MHGLSMGNDVLKQLHSEMSLDKVEKLMDQTREGVEYQKVCLALPYFNLPSSLLQVPCKEDAGQTTRAVLISPKGDRRGIAITHVARRGRSRSSGIGGITARSHGQSDPHFHPHFHRVEIG